MRPRSGCSKRTPVSSTATTTSGRPVVRAQAASMSIADATAAVGARRYHWPLAGPPGWRSGIDRGPVRYKGSFGHVQRCAGGRWARRIRPRGRPPAGPPAPRHRCRARAAPACVRPPRDRLRACARRARPAWPRAGQHAGGAPPPRARRRQRMLAQHGRVGLELHDDLALHRRARRCARPRRARSPRRPGTGRAKVRMKFIRTVYGGRPRQSAAVCGA